MDTPMNPLGVEPSGTGPLYWITAGDIAKNCAACTDDHRARLARVGENGITFGLTKDLKGEHWITETVPQALDVMATGVSPLGVWTREAAGIVFGPTVETWKLPELAAALVLKFGPAPLMPVPACAPSLALAPNPAEDLPAPSTLAELGAKAALDMAYTSTLLLMAMRLFPTVPLDALTEADIRLLRTRTRRLLDVVRLAHPTLAAEAWRGALAPIPPPTAPESDPGPDPGQYL